MRHLVTDLQAALGPERARAEPLELTLYARDAGVARGSAAVVCWPASGDDVATAVRITRRHGRPFDLTLTGPAGGRYRHGASNEALELDALDFCETLAGRTAGAGLLSTRVPF